MTDKVLCPWCGSRMWYKQLDHINGFYECPQCLACGPAGRGEADAKAAALRRYEPTCKPLTLKEVKDKFAGIAEGVVFLVEEKEKHLCWWSIIDRWDNKIFAT